MAKLQSGNGVQWKDSRSQRGTVESLAEHESSSLGSPDSELNGFANTETQPTNTDSLEELNKAQEKSKWQLHLWRDKRKTLKNCLYWRNRGFRVAMSVLVTLYNTFIHNINRYYCII